MTITTVTTPITTTITTTARRVGIALVAGLGLAGATSGVAAAEQPLRFEGSISFVETNPCSGDEIEFTVDFEELFVDHGDRTGVIRVQRTGTASDGSTSSGIEVNRRNRNGVELGNLNEVWTGVDGSKFQARGSYRFDYVNGELLSERFEVRCIRD